MFSLFCFSSFISIVKYSILNQQAKKDMDQLLERNKTRKKKPEGKKNTPKRSPRHLQAVSTALDRKPLPGIRRKSLQSGESWTSEEAKIVEDGKSSRTQPNSLVSHRLSKHLSVSAESDDHEMADYTDLHNEESFGDGSLRHSTNVGPSHSGEDFKTTAMGAIKAKSQHEDPLKVSNQIEAKVSLRAIPSLLV